MKTLIIIVHPDLKTSVANKRWVEELAKYPEKYEMHELYKAYPDERIDIKKEQELIESHERIIFQFPFYWFSSPPLLKKWFDEVLTYGWAYGSKSGFKFGGKKVALAISIGVENAAYTPQGEYKYTLQELTRPFELTFFEIRAKYRPLYSFSVKDATGVELDKSASDYIDFIQSV